MRFNKRYIKVHIHIRSLAKKKGTEEKNNFGINTAATTSKSNNRDEKINFILIALNRTHKPHQTIRYIL